MRNGNKKCDWCSTKCYPRFPPSFYVSTGHAEYPNPRNIEQLHSLANQIMPTFFDGIELGFRKCLAADNILTMRWVLSHARPSGFRIGGTYFNRRFDDVLETPIIYVDINPSSLSLNFGCIYYPLHNIRLEAGLQKSTSFFYKTFSADVYYPSTTYTINLYVQSKEQGRCTLSFLRSATRHLVLGTELLIKWNETERTKADLALAMRYSLHKCSTALTVSQQGFDISYWQRIHTYIQLGSSLAFNRNTRKVIASVCYQWKFRDTTIRGMLDSDMSVGFIYYRTLTHIPCVFALSLLLGIPVNRFTIGIKIDLDPCIDCGKFDDRTYTL